MILTSVVFFGVAMLPLTVATALQGFTSLSAATAVLWLLSLPMVRARDVRLAHLYVTVCVGLITFITFSGIPFPLTLLSMAALIAGWDAALATAHFSGPTSAAAGAASRHSLQIVLYLAGTAAVVLVVRLATIPLGFGSGLFLALGGIALAISILRQLRRTEPATADVAAETAALPSEMASTETESLQPPSTPEGN